MSRKALDASSVHEALADLPGWAYENDALKKTYTFGSFREAMGFLLRLAFEAEALDHHPELHNVYNRVDVALTTHDAGDRVTDTDLKLARAIEAFAWS